MIEHTVTRITPAYAGTTPTAMPIGSPTGDHPRIRGNHFVVFVVGIPISGSPPHTREPLKDSSGTMAPVRITPAYAGTTPNSLKNPKLNQDHPRIRGNHIDNVIFVNGSQGSPPHTREPQIKDPLKSTFSLFDIVKNIDFARQAKYQLCILKCPMRHLLIDPIRLQGRLQLVIFLENLLLFYRF